MGFLISGRKGKRIMEDGYLYATLKNAEMEV